MIPRRNIRLKCMQTLYMLSTSPVEEQEKRPIAERWLDSQLDRSLDLVTLMLLYMVRVAEYSRQDARQRAAKYLPSEEDRRVSTQIAENQWIEKLRQNESFRQAIQTPRIQHLFSEDWVRKVYQQLILSPAYAEYLNPASLADPQKADQQILEYLWKSEMLGNEAFMEQFAEDHPSWEDDGAMSIQLIERWLAGSQKINFSKIISQQKREYAHELVRTVLEKEAYCRSLIEPKLINWDAERVALIDLLLLRMGLCEFLYFSSIPTKVTINEYIEIAKQYSTPQSGQFINGVLDKLLKELEKDGKINKIVHNP